MDERVLIPFLTFTPATFLLVPLVIHLAEKVGIYDYPDEERKLHSAPMPRTGGIVVLFFFVVSYFLYGKHLGIFAFLGGLLIFTVGFLDDTVGVYSFVGVDKKYNPLVKFGFQTLSIVFAVIFGGVVIKYFGGGEAPIIADYILTFLWFLVLINGVNFSDGIDGLCTGLCMISLFFFALISYLRGTPSLLQFELALLAGLLGYFPYAFPKAKVFLGDGGSYLLGYLLAIVSVKDCLKKPTVALVILPIAFLLIFILDVVFVSVRRFANHKGGVKERLFAMLKPDKKHLHHLLLERVRSPVVVTIIMFVFSASLGVVALCLAMLTNFS